MNSLVQMAQGLGLNLRFLMGVVFMVSAFMLLLYHICWVLSMVLRSGPCGIVSPRGCRRLSAFAAPPWMKFPATDSHRSERTGERAGWHSPHCSCTRQRATYIYSADTAVPYNIEKFLGATVATRTGWPQPGGRGITTTVRVITAVFPAILARVALFYVNGPSGTITPVLRATSTRNDGTDAVKKFLVRSYDASYTLGGNEELISLTYKVRPLPTCLKSDSLASRRLSTPWGASSN